MIRAEKLAPCDGCRTQAMYVNAPEFAGVSGFMDDTAIQAMTAGSSAVMVGGALLQGGLTGALIGGLAAGSMKGAATGGLLAGGLGASFAGGALLVVSGQNPELRVPGAIGLVAGLAALVAGGFRARRAIKGR